MNLIDGLKATFTFLSSVFIVISVCFLGWFLVYKLFLLRFKVVRELLGQLNEPVDNKGNDPKPKVKKIRREQ